MLFINIATLLFAFNFEPPTGADGNVVLPDPEAIEDSGVTACVLIMAHVYRPSLEARL
jgi:hypothetical protein